MAFERDNLMTCQQEDGGYRRQSLLSEGATSRHLDVLLTLVFYFSIPMASLLQHAQPVEPRGWFRWLHDHFAGRRALDDSDLEKNQAEQGWGERSQRFPDLSPKERAELISHHCPPRLERGPSRIDWGLEAEPCGRHDAVLAEVERLFSNRTFENMTLVICKRRD
jgi:hypothetical protein